MKPLHVVTPSDKGLFQNVIGKNRAEAIPFEQYPLVVNGAFNPGGVSAYRLLVADKASLKTQIHPAASGEEGEHGQRRYSSGRLLREGWQLRFTDQISVAVV